MSKLFAFLIGICYWSASYTQKHSDSLSYTKYDRHLVLYTDYGWNTAPMSIHYPFSNGIKQVKFRNNFNSVLGFGFSYRWASLRFGIRIPNSVRKKDKYGNTKYYDLGFDFSFRNMFFDVDWHYYQGYVAKNAWQWNDTITKDEPNLIRNDLGAASFSINAWQFFKNDFKMAAFRGKTALYHRDTRSFYLKYTMNYHGISTSDGLSIIPTELIDTNQSKTSSNSLGAFDVGVVPGYAYVRRWRIFQMGIIGGVGVVLQSKIYTFGDNSRYFLGLAPRADVKVMAGINKPKYFIMFMGDFDNKSITFNDFRYTQTFYSLKLYAGVRLDVRKKKVKEREAAEAESRKAD